MFEVQQQGAHCRLWLSAPESRNKLSVGLLEALKTTLDGLATRGLTVLSLASTSSQIFAAGADMNELLQLDEVSARDYAALGQSVMNALADFPCPVVALVAGPCFGGGFDLAMACDWIWAADNAVFCHPGAYLGIMTGFGGTVRLPKRLPPATARHMLATGGRLKAERAYHLGLVSALYPDHAAMLAGFEARLQTEEPLRKRAAQ